MIIILTGVSGSGKTTIGQLLSRELGWQFIDSDELHPLSNIEKMKNGIALTDEDRLPWLNTIRERIIELSKKNNSAIIACSALKRKYRQYLLSEINDIRLVYLKGTYEVIEKRLKTRKNHFFDATLLSSQFETLEEPRNILTVDITNTPDKIVDMIRKKFSL